MCRHIKESSIEPAAPSNCCDEIIEEEDCNIDNNIRTPVEIETENLKDECYEDYEFLDNVFQINEPVNSFDIIGNSYQCPICLEMCGESVEYAIEHLKNHDQNQEWGSFLKDSEFFQTYICNICVNNKSLKRRFEFIVHIRRHLNIKPHKCPYCVESSFYSSNLLKRHISKSHCNMSCSKCSEIFIDKNDFNYHTKNVHKQDTDKIFSCLYCDKCFTSLKNSKIHEKMHTELAKFKCTMCEKFYHRKTDLKRHLNVHLGNKPFKCTFCETSYFTRSELNRHMIYHTSIKSFQCNFCDKSFYESGHLTMHQKSIHLKIKEFSCEFCGKEFTTSHKLKRHQMAKSCKGNKQEVEEEENSEIINFIENDQNLPMEILNVNFSADDIPSHDLHEFTINNFDGINMEIDSGINENLNMNSNYEIINIANGPVMEGKKINVIGLRNINDEIQNYLLVEESLNDDNNPFVFNENENI